MPSFILRRFVCLFPLALLIYLLTGCAPSATPSPANGSPMAVDSDPSVEAEEITPANIAKWCQCDIELTPTDVSAEMIKSGHPPGTWAYNYTRKGTPTPLLTIIISPLSEELRLMIISLSIVDGIRRESRQPDPFSIALSYALNKSVPTPNDYYPLIRFEDSGFKGWMMMVDEVESGLSGLVFGVSEQYDKEFLLLFPPSDDGQESLFSLSPLEENALLQRLFRQVAAQIAAESSNQP